MAMEWYRAAPCPRGCDSIQRTGFRVEYFLRERTGIKHAARNAQRLRFAQHVQVRVRPKRDAPTRCPARGGSWLPGRMYTGPGNAARMSAAFCTSSRSTRVILERVAGDEHELASMLDRRSHHPPRRGQALLADLRRPPNPHERPSCPVANRRCGGISCWISLGEMQT